MTQRVKEWRSSERAVHTHTHSVLDDEAGQKEWRCSERAVHTHSVLDDADAEDPFAALEREEATAGPLETDETEVQHSEQQQTAITNKMAHSVEFCRNGLRASRTPHRYYDRMAGYGSGLAGLGVGGGSGSAGSGSGLAGPGGSTSQCKPKERERLDVSVVPSLTLPGSRTSSFLKWAESSEVIKRLGITQQQINRSVSSMSSVSGLVGVSNLAQHSHIQMIEDKGNDAGETSFEYF